METNKQPKDIPFKLALENTVKEFGESGEVRPETAAEMTQQIIKQIGIQETDMPAVEEALKEHYYTLRYEEYRNAAMSVLGDKG